MQWLSAHQPQSRGQKRQTALLGPFSEGPWLASIAGPATENTSDEATSAAATALAKGRRWEAGGASVGDTIRGVFMWTSL